VEFYTGWSRRNMLAALVSAALSPRALAAVNAAVEATTVNPAGQLVGVTKYLAAGGPKRPVVLLLHGTSVPSQ
jgi:hypothetical protein